MSSNNDLAVVSVGGNGGGRSSGGKSKKRIQLRVDKGIEALNVSDTQMTVTGTILSDTLADQGDAFSVGAEATVMIDDAGKIKAMRKYLIKDEELKTTFEEGAILTFEDVEVSGAGIKANFGEYFSANPFEVTANTGAKVMDRIPLLSKYLRIGEAGEKRQKVTLYGTDQAVALSGPDGVKSPVAEYLASLVPHAQAYIKAHPEAKDFVEVWLGAVNDFDNLSGLDQIETIVDGWRFDPAIQGIVPNSQYAAVIRAIDCQAAPDAENAILSTEIFQGSMSYDDPNGSGKKLYRQMAFSEMVENAVNYGLERKLKRAPSPEERINYADMIGGNVMNAVAPLMTEVEKDGQKVPTFGSRNLDQMIKFLHFLDNTSLSNQNTRAWEVIPTIQLGIVGDSLKTPKNVQHTAAWNPRKEAKDREGKHYRDSIIMKGSIIALAFSSKRNGTDDKYMISKAVAQDAFVSMNAEKNNPVGPTFMVNELPTRTTDALGHEAKMQEIGAKRTQDVYNHFNWKKDGSKDATNENEQEGNEHSAPPAPGQ